MIEIRTPSDRMYQLRDKMRRYILAGVLLGWLIDPIKNKVDIYRPDREPEIFSDPASVAGEGPVEGFVLDLAGILA